ncbi:MAG: hypothetical protein ABUR63_04380, partial [Verrucomicrobiota bacterium]
QRLTLLFWLTASASLSAGACAKRSVGEAPARVPPLAPASGIAKAEPAAADRLPPSGALPAPAPAALQALTGAQAAANDSDEGASANAVLPEKETVSGTIVLPAVNRGKVARGDVMFLAARRAGGPPGPASMLAVQKLVAEDFPMRFSISRRDAMIPGMPFAGRMSITVRVDKDGDAMTRRKGEVYGQADDVPLGSQNVVITLNKVQTEDRTLAQPISEVGGLPPGHP